MNKNGKDILLENRSSSAYILLAKQILRHRKASDHFERSNTPAQLRFLLHTPAKFHPL